MNRSAPVTVQITVTTTTHANPAYDEQLWAQGQANAHSSRKQAVEVVAPPNHTHRRSEPSPKWQDRPLRMQTNHVSGSLRRCTQPQERTQGAQSMLPRTKMPACPAPIQTD